MADAHLAGAGPWQRLVHREHVWGTVITIEVRDEQVSDHHAAAAIAAAVELSHQVDAMFSTYRADSAVTALRTGAIALPEAPAAVRDVWHACAIAKWRTRGAFDPWAVPGGFDPSGLVKGWAADRMAETIVAAGFRNVCINAAGDVTCRGEQAPGEPWSVGIRHPESALEVVRTVRLTDTAVATSGRYERGEHIINPRPHSGPMKLKSASVVGPDGALADALATALVIAGTDGAEFFSELPDWSAYLISGTEATYFGPAFT